MENTASPSFVSPKKGPLSPSMIEEYLLQPPFTQTLIYINLFCFYLLLMFAVANVKINFMYAFLYPPVVYAISIWRDDQAEKMRQGIAHRIPFFADALANSLSVGSTLEQALKQSSYYLKGRIKEEFHSLIVRFALGEDLGTMLRQLDGKFPRTGLRYLISLLEEYRELGVGISPMLKRIAVALTEKEEAENKIRTILATGSSYARLSILMFGFIFFAMSFFLRDQLVELLLPPLKAGFLFLLVWTAVGIMVVTRITAMDFAKNSALKPQIAHFLKEKKFTVEEKMNYSGMQWSWLSRQFFYYLPLIIGFCIAYITSWYYGSPLIIFLFFCIGYLGFKMILEYYLNGLFEDQLVKTIEVFPEALQVFIIGLNSGLNTYKAFEFAENSIRGSAPKILSEELCRTRFAMECGEKHSWTWQRLAEMLPFETVIDFSEIMVIAPMHGESIVRSITQMVNSYQAKKLLLIEKKATSLSQIVIPIIVIAFFPLFLYAIFGPLVVKISSSFHQ